MQAEPSQLIVEVGGVVSSVFKTVTVLLAEVAWLPAVSKARALMVCGPSGTLVESQLML